jgi:O-antigen ligase
LKSKHFLNCLLIGVALVAIFFFSTGSQVTRISFSGVSLSATLTVITALLLSAGVIFLVRHLWIRSGTKNFFKYLFFDSFFALPIFLFLLFSLFSLFLAPSLQGLQNFLTIALFGLSIVIFSLAASEKLRGQIFQGIIWATIVFSLASLFLWSLGSEYIDNRSFAMTAVIGLSAVIPFWNRNIITRIAPFVIFTAILLSASRIATLAAIVVFGFIALQKNASFIKNALRMTVVYLFASLASALVYLLVPVTNARLNVGDQGLVIDPGANLKPSSEEISQVSDSTTPLIVVNTNGRIEAWSEFLSTMKTPVDFIFGRGTGSSAVYGQENLPYFSQVLNEYLRVYLDNGLFGLILFITLLVMLFAAVLKPLKNFGEYQLAGLLALIAGSIVALTDGQFIYPFTSLTMGVVVGLALIERSQQRFKTIS